VPLLEALIGPQPELPDAGPVSRQNRFNRNCDALLRVFASAEHPLVLFLDDVQWADSASLELVRSWLVQEIKHTMLIRAYRDNEVGPDHPLSLMLRQTLADRVESSQIQLTSLDQSQVEELIADTLRRARSDVRSLAAVHMQKTGGNPFFLIQMFQGLYQDGLISFGTDGWTWSLEEIASRDLTDNVVELMTRRLQRYSVETCSALNMGAILGAEFPIDTLAIVLESSSESAYRAVLPAITDGLFLESEGRLKFAHDKIHEASYRLVDEGERMQRHRRVGRHLMSTLSEAAVESQIFKIVDDLNRSRDLIQDDSERAELARLNVRAGKKALASSAFAPAIALFQTASALLGVDPWQREQELAFEASYGSASACFALARYDECERALSACLEHVSDPIRTAPAVDLLLSTYFSQNRHLDCVQAGLARLKQLEIHITERPTKAHVLIAYARFRISQGRRPTASLLNLPVATDQRAIAAMRILGALVPSTYMVHTDLMALVALQMGILSIEYGNTERSPFAYGMLMVTQAGVFKDIRGGEQYNTLAFAVHDRYPNPYQRAQIEMLRTTFEMH
jgi:predicted ATPase